MKTKIIATAAVVIAATLSACGEDKVTNTDPQVVKNARLASLCYGYYTNLAKFVDENGNVLNDQNFLKDAAEKNAEVYEDALDDFLDDGAITKKTIDTDVEKAEVGFSTTLDANAMYKGAHETCGLNLITLMSPQDLLKLTRSYHE